MFSIGLGVNPVEQGCDQENTYCGCEQLAMLLVNVARPETTRDERVLSRDVNGKHLLF